MAGLDVTRYRMQNACGGVRVPSAGLMMESSCVALRAWVGGKNRGRE